MKIELGFVAVNKKTKNVFKGGKGHHFSPTGVAKVYATAGKALGSAKLAGYDSKLMVAVPAFMEWEETV